MSQHQDAHDACIGRVYNRRKKAMKELAELRVQAGQIGAILKPISHELENIGQSVTQPYAPALPECIYPPCEEVAALLVRFEALQQEIAECNDILD